MTKYHKRDQADAVEAVCYYGGNLQDIINFIGLKNIVKMNRLNTAVQIETPEDQLEVELRSYVIKDEGGNFCTIPISMFENTYEPVVPNKKEMTALVLWLFNEGYMNVNTGLSEPGWYVEQFLEKENS